MIRNITEDRMKTGTQPLLVCTVAASSATVTHLSLLSGPIRHLETHVRLSLLHRQSLCIQLNFWSGRLLFLDVCVSELLFSCSSQSAPQSVQRPGWCAGWLMRTKPTFAFPNAQQFIDIWFLMITSNSSDIRLQDYGEKGKKNHKFLLIRPKRDESQPTIYTDSFHLGLQKFFVCILSRSLMGRFDVMFVAVPNIWHSKVKDFILTTEKSQV